MFLHRGISLCGTWSCLTAPAKLDYVQVPEHSVL